MRALSPCLRSWTFEDWALGFSVMSTGAQRIGAPVGARVGLASNSQPSGDSPHLPPLGGTGNRARFRLRLSQAAHSPPSPGQRLRPALCVRVEPASNSQPSGPQPGTCPPLGGIRSAARTRLFLFKCLTTRHPTHHLPSVKTPPRQGVGRRCPDHPAILSGSSRHLFASRQPTRHRASR